VSGGTSQEASSEGSGKSHLTEIGTLTCRFLVPAGKKTSHRRLRRCRGCEPARAMYSSIVMAILLCRRIRIATRGCTSKAAPLTLGPASPAGLTARARPGMRAANLR